MLQVLNKKRVEKGHAATSAGTSFLAFQVPTSRKQQKWDPA